jgi:regulator of protease activity HflC (stomatin/prohibitin superfamily)
MRTSGLHFLGIGHSFIKFPINVQTIEFSKEATANQPPISSRTLDGLEVILEISFQYVLQSENLFKLYNKYGETYQQVFQNVAIDVLTEEATGYTAYDFFMDRGRIKDDFQNSLNKKLAEVCYANIQFLQLRNVDLPTAFEESIQESEVKKQDIQKATAELNKVRIEVETKIKAAEFQKDVTINLAQGEAQAILNENNAEIKSLRKLQESQTAGYSNLKTNLGMNNQQLMDFIKNKLIKNYDGHNMALNIETPEVKKTTAE